jgi:SAM-dependent methyltransferase
MKRLFRIIVNAYIDFSVQRRFCGGTVKAVHNKLADAKATSNSNYNDIAIVFFTLLEIEPQDVIVDVGCGKGRVLNFLLYKGVKNKIIGVEINSNVALLTRNALKRFSNVSIIDSNINDTFPIDGTIFYLYNPFGLNSIVEFSNFFKSLKTNFKIVYLSPTHKDVFINDNFYDTKLVFNENLTYPVLIVTKK